MVTEVEIWFKIFLSIPVSSVLLCVLLESYICDLRSLLLIMFNAQNNMNSCLMILGLLGGDQQKA